MVGDNLGSQGPLTFSTVSDSLKEIPLANATAPFVVMRLFLKIITNIQRLECKLHSKLYYFCASFCIYNPGRGHFASDLPLSLQVELLRFCADFEHLVACVGTRVCVCVYVCLSVCLRQVQLLQLILSAFHTHPQCVCVSVCVCVCLCEREVCVCMCVRVCVCMCVVLLMLGLVLPRFVLSRRASPNQYIYVCVCGCVYVV